MSDRTKLACVLTVLNRIAKEVNLKSHCKIRLDADKIFRNLSSEEIDFYYRKICGVCKSDYEINAQMWLCEKGVSA